MLLSVDGRRYTAHKPLPRQRILLSTDGTRLLGVERTRQRTMREYYILINLDDFTSDTARCV